MIKIMNIIQTAVIPIFFHTPGTPSKLYNRWTGETPAATDEAATAVLYHVMSDLCTT